MVRFSGSAILSCLLALIALNDACAISIDDFHAGEDGVTLNSGSGGVEAYKSDLSSAQVLGGGRKLRAVGNKASITPTQLTIYGGLYLHSQPADGTGMTAVIWDGDPAGDPSKIESGKLNASAGVDFYQDEGTKFRVRIYSFDFAGSMPVTINLIVYDAANPGAVSISSHVLNGPIGPTRATKSLMLEYPFAGFTKLSSATVPADLHHIGALMLQVDGANPDSDLIIDYLDTDGVCAIIPDGAGRVKDDCGVCAGTNQDKDLCGVCFGANRDMDQCGICFGQNRTVDDCGICGGGNLSKDACGVCGGDNKKCTDCMGVPNGTARIDECGVCGGNGKSCLDCAGVPFGTAQIDCCGICGGDGSSCEEKCKVYNLVSTKRKLSSSVIRLYDTIKKYSTQEYGCIRNRSGKRVAATRIKIAKEILKSSQEDLAEYYQDRVKICETIYCSRVKLKSVGQTLKKNVDKLYQLSRWSQYGADRACKTKKKTTKKNSLKEYQNATVSIKGLPAEKCE